MAGRVEVTMMGLGPRRTLCWSAGTLWGLTSLAAGLAAIIALACFSYPSREREARAYDQARQQALATAGRSGCRCEPAVVGGQWQTTARRPRWTLWVISAGGVRRRLRMSRGDLGSDLGVGSRVTALFWRGKVAALLRGGQQAETWDGPDWQLSNARVGVGVCSLFLLLLVTGPAVFGTANWLRRFL